MTAPVATYEVSTPVEYFDLLLPENDPLPRRYRMVMENLVCDRSLTAPDSLITFFMGFGDPLVWYEGPSYPVYPNTGLSNFAGETNPAYAPPFAFRTPQTLRTGCRSGIDTGGGKLWGGTSGTIHVDCPGVVSGNPVAPSYHTKARNVFDEWPANTVNSSTGLPYYPADGTQMTCWVTPFEYDGCVYSAHGLIPRGFRFRNNGATLDGFKFISGRVELYAEGLGQESGSVPPPPSPPPSYTSIGDLSAPQYAFDGTLNKACAGGSCSYKAAATQTWVGKAWAAAFQPSVIGCYPSNNAGWVNGVDPSVTVRAYYSDTAPAHATDGTLIGTQVVTDANYPGVYCSWPAHLLPTTPHLYHWVVVSHAGSATSMYVAQAVIA